MSSTLDKSLDEIITSRPRGRKGARKTRSVAGTAAAATNGPVKGAARERYSGVVPAANGNRAPTAVNTTIPTADATKILVSNLPTDVNEIQIKELFTSTVGATKEVVITYDAKGHSKGTASVTFHKRGDANKAFKEYNGRLVDGSRAMKIEIIYDPAKPATLSQRVAPAPATAPTAPAAGRGAANQTASGRQSGARRGRGRGRGGKGSERPKKSAEDLDAEMEDYSKTAAPAS